LIDLDGGNCLDGGPLGLALLRYDVSAQDDWWGGPVRALPVGGTLTASRTLAARPPYC
jgi:hypothetical protein